MQEDPRQGQETPDKNRTDPLPAEPETESTDTAAEPELVDVPDSPRDGPGYVRPVPLPTDHPRVLTRHLVADSGLRIAAVVLDAPDRTCGACHNYVLREVAGLPSRGAPVLHPEVLSCLNFQNGPLRQGSRANGISQEGLLMVLIDRLTGFQAGAFHCVENAKALVCIQEALDHLMARTRDRVTRGVEGTVHR